YHSGPTSLSLGLQGAGILTHALQKFRIAMEDKTTPLDLFQVSERVRAALVDYASPIIVIAQELAAEDNILFGGIDLSPAPMGEDSIVMAMELCGYDLVGTPGTLAVASALTTALKIGRAWCREKVCSVDV